MAVLEVKNIKKNFGKTKVLKGVSFSLEKGIPAVILLVIGILVCAAVMAAGAVINRKTARL